MSTEQAIRTLTTTTKKEKVHLLEIDKNVCSALSLKSDNDFKTSPGYVPWYSLKKNLKLCQKQVPNNGSIIRGKRFLGLLSIIMFFLYMNSTLIRNDVDEPIRVIHYSHVPGMKAKSANLSHIFTTLTKTKLTTNTYATNSNTPSSGNESSGYLVWSDRCKILNMNPYKPDIMKFFKREQYEPCGNGNPLTTVEYNETTKRYLLVLIENNLKLYRASYEAKCCYQVIHRNFSGEQADKKISLGVCTGFTKQVELTNTIDNIIVRCYEGKKEVYKNGHAMIPFREEIFERQKLIPSDYELRAPSVLMIGIDSISRLNLIRAMPKTAQYLYDNEWFEMSGYNKIDDNTFPNLMAVLTGRNPANARNVCAPTVLGGLDKCNFIWKDFEKQGYVTAYAEDAADINTFNYYKKGFEKPPVDHYLRPFVMAAERNLHTTTKSGLIDCLGYQHAAEHIYDYALHFALRYKEKPFFGLFWTNSFSHNALSDCSSMDERMVDYLKAFAELGTFNKTVVIFFSDHGMRFGPSRKTLSGHYEERLPFMFIWLPPYMKQTHPEFVSALSINKNRLTNPYDLHVTLKHILHLTNSTQQQTQFPAAISCEHCQSLLKVVPHNRSCEEIEIEDHWCTCVSYQSVYKDSKLIKNLADHTIDYINSYVQEFRNGSFAKKCAPLALQKIENAYRGHNFKNCVNCEEIYRLVFYTKPNRGLFEATVRYHPVTLNLNVTGEISRLNSYATDSECVNDGGAKKYCSCVKRKKHG